MYLPFYLRYRAVMDQQFVQALEYFIVKQRITYGPLDLSIASAGRELTSALRDALLLAERHVLRCLGFAVYSFAEYPHKYLPGAAMLFQVPAAGMQSVWSVCNDAMLVSLVEYTGLEVAAACIAIALDRMGSQDSAAYTAAMESMQIEATVVLDIMQKIHTLYRAVNS
jgi:hypothetical protein